MRCSWRAPSRPGRHTCGAGSRCATFANGSGMGGPRKAKDETRCSWPTTCVSYCESTHGWSAPPDSARPPLGVGGWQRGRSKWAAARRQVDGPRQAASGHARWPHCVAGSANAPRMVRCRAPDLWHGRGDSRQREKKSSRRHEKSWTRRLWACPRGFTGTEICTISVYLTTPYPDHAIERTRSQSTQRHRIPLAMSHPFGTSCRSRVTNRPSSRCHVTIFA